MKKKQLREKYLQKRLEMSPAEVESQSRAIFERLVDRFPLQKAKNVSLFLSVTEKNEVDTRWLVEYLWENGVNVFVPKIFKKELISVPFTLETKLVKSAWGIEEPEQNEGADVVYDYVITPLLYVDSSGNRVGYGAGFYDRFFASVNADAIKVGIGFFPPKEHVEDLLPHDVRIDYLVTAAESFSFETSKSRK